MKENKEIDLTKVENQMLVAKKWFEYKDKINIPKEMVKEIDGILKDYHDGFIPNNEVYNKILD